MAIDFSMLQNYPVPSAIRFRHYDWNQPAFTYGRFQRWDTIEEMAAPLMAAGLIGAQRPTGGGIVDHREDWTYALVIPRAVGLARASPAKVYQCVHDALRLALCEREISCSLFSEQRVEKQCGVCFSAPEMFDLVQTGTNKKLAGAALRRTREGILLQGSVATNAIISRRSDRAELAAAFARALATQCDAEIKDTNLDPTRLIASADRIF